MAIQGGRPNNRQVVPYLMVRDGRAALDFYQKAFGAKVIYQAPMPGMPGIFAQFRVGESYLQLTDLPAFDPKGPRSPETLGGTSVVLEMYVDDVDKSFAHAVELGGTPLLPPTDMFFGDRYCWVGDPWGHVWALATVKDALTEGEVQRRAEEFMLATAKNKCDVRRVSGQWLSQLGAGPPHCLSEPVWRNGLNPALSTRANVKERWPSGLPNRPSPARSTILLQFDDMCLRNLV